MGTSRRLLGIVLLLALVGGGGILLYREHERQAAERVAAAADGAPPATDAAAAPATAPAGGTDPTAGAGAPSSDGGATAEADAAATADTAESPASSDPQPTAAASEAGTAERPDAGAATAGADAASAGSAETSAAPETAAAAPAMPEETISQPEPVVPPVAGVPTFDIVRVEPGGDAVMAGRSDPGMVIALFANGQEIGRTRANDSGEWVITLERPLGPGEYVITVVGATPDGARQVESVDRIAVSIPDAKSEPPMVALLSPDAPTQVLQQPEAPEATVAAASSAPAGSADSTAAATGGAGDAGGAAPPPAWAQPFAGDAGSAPAATVPPAGPDAPAPAITALAVGLVEKDGDRLTVSGASLPGATVRVYVNDAPLGDAVADAAGRWTFTGRHPVEAGDHTVRADQVDPATGAVIARAAVPFEVLSAAEIATAPATPETPDVALPAPTPAETAGAEPAPAVAGAVEAGPRRIRIRKGDDLWTLAERYYGKRGGTRYTAIYRANRKQIRNPDLIYPGQVFVIPR